MIKSLVSLRLRSALLSVVSGKDKSGKARALSGGKLAVTAILLVFLLACFVFISFSTSVGMAMVLVPLGHSELYFGIFTALSLAVIFFFSIFETKSELFECKDNALLLSLPIKPGHIIISRILVVLIYNYAIEAIIAVPALLSYYLCAGTGASAIFGTALVFIALPMLATALASGVGYLVALFSSRFRYKTLATVVFSVIFIAAYFVGYGALLDGMDSFAEDLLQNVASLGESLGFIIAIGSVTFLSPIPTLVFIAVSFGAAYAAYAVIARNYVSMITDSRGSAKRAYRAKRQVKRGVIHALAKKELARFASSAGYILNSSMGLIFCVLLTGGVLFAGADVISTISALASELGAARAEDVISPLLIMLYALVASTNTISASALSLEGKSFWIIKSLPVSSSDVIIAKTIPHIIICAPVTAITALVSAIAVNAPIYYYPLYILTPIVITVLFANVGILLNVLFPKFDYINEMQVVKQSLPVFLSIIVPMILMTVLGGITVVLSVLGFGLLFSILVLLVSALLVAVTYALMLGPAASRLARL